VGGGGGWWRWVVAVGGGGGWDGNGREGGLEKRRVGVREPA
jgi:hypothetical protein